MKLFFITSLLLLIVPHGLIFADVIVADDKIANDAKSNAKSESKETKALEALLDSL